MSEDQITDNEWITAIDKVRAERDALKQRLEKAEAELAEEKRQHSFTMMGADTEAHEADRLRVQLAKEKRLGEDIIEDIKIAICDVDYMNKTHAGKPWGKGIADEIQSIVTRYQEARKK